MAPRKKVVEADEPEESKEDARERRSRERDHALARLETVAGNFPHVGKGGLATAELVDAARRFAAAADASEADELDPDAKDAAVDADMEDVSGEVDEHANGPIVDEEDARREDARRDEEDARE